MARGPGPTVAVLEDLGDPKCSAGWWGEVHVAVHKGLGLKGAITNGVMRDLDVFDDGSSIFHGSLGPSPCFALVRELSSVFTFYCLRLVEPEFTHHDRHG